MSDSECTYFRENDTVVRVRYNDCPSFNGSESIDICIPNKIRGKEISAIGHYFFTKSGIPNVHNANLIISEGIEVISDYAFHGFSQLRSVTLPSTLKKIGQHAFAMTGLKSIRITGSVDIESKAFACCDDLKKIDLSSCYLTSLMSDAFAEDKIAEEDIILPYYMAEDDDVTSVISKIICGYGKSSSPRTSTAFDPKGKTVVVTGKFSVTRAALERMISAAGGYADSRVTSHTDCLLVGDRPGATKLNAAKLHGVTLIPTKEVESFIASS